MKTKTISKEKYFIVAIVDETNDNHHFQLVVVYISSKCQLGELVKDLSQLLESQMSTIITGDFNFDRNEKNALSSFLAKKKFRQLVKWPSHDKGRTLDHCYISENVRVQLTRYSPFYTDHDSLCIKFEHFPWY